MSRFSTADCTNIFSSFSSDFVFVFVFVPLFYAFQENNLAFLFNFTLDKHRSVKESKVCLFFPLQFSWILKITISQYF